MHEEKDKRKRRSELSYVESLNLGVGVSFKDNTVMSLDSIQDGEWGT